MQKHENLYLNPQHSCKGLGMTAYLPVTPVQNVWVWLATNFMPDSVRLYPKGVWWRVEEQDT